MFSIDAAGWVAIGFFLFLGVLAYYGVFRKITDALDARIAGVEKDMFEAKRLRDEAQALLASLDQKRKDAEIEAQKIIAAAQAEAQAATVAAKARLQEYIERRTKQAEEKIAIAETQAALDVRFAAADGAAKVTAQLLQSDLKPAQAAKLVDNAIADVGRLMH